ncbi:inorganic diphosphatase [Mucilaginibacter sp. RS28]|uniref:inorganic diphosphatase n=1 Tax=Mucilaginibacter straminoryzae TaxID=2932774 RepID=A0A9X2B876_9SPHI|nr:inorganic diphosphatase [Mucilaginibacter straminoryzae]MCJ8209176.1 inorganic diphosphatase [Mucilaginibacter straminoryzae]
MDSITAIIESPKGSGHKYDYEPEMQCFKLKKVMPAGLVFPFDFGFMPGTKGEDGDPLDIIVISEIKSFPGCCMDCRIIGGIMAEQTEENGETVRNDRFLGIPEVSHLFKDHQSIDDLPEGIITQIERFFENYNEQAGKKFKVLKRQGAEEAYTTIRKALKE